jgi:uncharacterized protein (TIGR03000 family)
MFRSRLLSVGVLTLAAAVLGAPRPALADPPPGMSKMWPWNVNPNGGYNEPPNRPSAPEPGQPPLPPRKYQVHTYTMMEKTAADEANSVEVVAHMPPDADIWFEGTHLPRKDATMREFLSPPLKPGVNYVYDIRVNWGEEGHRAEQALKVRVQAGDIVCLDLREVGHKDVQAEIKANLDKLSPEDRKLAEAQGRCAVQENNPLGSMGRPVKVTLNGQPVFLCCPACRDKAERAPEATLARARELSEKRTGQQKP